MTWCLRSLSALVIATCLLALVSIPILPVEKALSLGTNCNAQSKYTLVVHGGAVWGNTLHTKKEEHIRSQLRHRSQERLASGRKAIDVVTEIIASMEDSALFNAGRGSIANTQR